MSAHLLQRPPDGDRDRGPAQIAIWWAEFGAVAIMVVLRFNARIMIRAIGVDDWMMIINVILYAITCSLVTYLASIGGFRHMYYLTPPEQFEAVKWNWIAQVFGILLFGAGKIAVALLLIRILGPNSYWRKRLLYVIIVSAAIFNVLGAILGFVQCNPPRALWTPGIPSRCWNPKVQSDYAIFNSTWNVFLDFVLALLPITIFWNLNMTVLKRTSLCALLGLGLFAGICGCVKISFLSALSSRSDFTWATYDLYTWTTSESFLVLFCACVPPLKSLYDRYFNKPSYYSKYGSNSKSSAFPLKRAGYRKQAGSSDMKGPEHSISERNLTTTDIEGRPTAEGGLE